MFISLQSSSLSLLVNRSVSWRVTTTCWSVPDTIACALVCIHVCLKTKLRDIYRKTAPQFSSGFRMCTHEQGFCDTTARSQSWSSIQLLQVWCGSWTWGQVGATLCPPVKILKILSVLLEFLLEFISHFLKHVLRGSAGFWQSHSKYATDKI